MFGVLEGVSIIAIHHDVDVVKTFIRQQDNDRLEIVKFKKKVKKAIKNSPELSDLYLIDYKGIYVPQRLFDTMCSEESEREYDIKYCRDVLLKLLKEQEINTKEEKYIMKTINVLTKKLKNRTALNSGGNIDINVLNSVKELDDSFRYHIHTD